MLVFDFISCLSDTPGPIDNSRIAITVNGQPTIRLSADYGQISEDMWRFLHGIYTGGPEIIVKQRQQTLHQMSNSPARESRHTTQQHTTDTPQNLPPETIPERTSESEKTASVEELPVRDETRNESPVRDTPVRDSPVPEQLKNPQESLEEVPVKDTDNVSVLENSENNLVNEL